MRILLTNDDGYGSWGIESLYDQLDAMGHEVYIAAPATEKSASSHAITVRDSMTLEWHSSHKVAISGFPADCVNVVLIENLFPPMDLIVSGINHGPNMGYDVIYSGTVAGARQGRLHQINSIALSLDTYQGQKTDFEIAAKWLEQIFPLLANIKSPFLLNINMPLPGAGKMNGYKFTKLGAREYIDRYRFLQTIPRPDWFEKTGNKALSAALPAEVIIEGRVGHKDRGGNTDFLAVEQGYIAITPLSIEQTDYETLDQWSKHSQENS